MRFLSVYMDFRPRTLLNEQVRSGAGRLEQDRSVRLNLRNAI